MKIKVAVNQQTRPVDIHKHLAEVSRGTGVSKPRKGKGSYTRKSKRNWGE